MNRNSPHHLIGSSLTPSEETTQLLFKNIPIPTFVWKKQDQNFILVDYNDAAAAITNGKIGSLLGAEVKDLTADNPEIQNEIWQCFADKTVVEKQRVYRLKTTGESRHFATRHVFVPPDLVLTYSEDTTLFEETTQKFKESETRYQELANLLPQTIFETDSAYNLTYSNQAGFDAFGFSPDDLKRGLNIFDLIVPEQREQAAKNIIRLMQGEKSAGNEYTALRKDGSTFAIQVFSLPIIHNGKIVGLRGILIDISKLKAAELALKNANEALEKRVAERTAQLEQANVELKGEIAQRLRAQEILQQNEEKYRAVVEQSVECVFLVDLNTKYVIEANPAFLRLLGYSAAEVKNLQVYDFIAHDREDIDQKIKLVLERGSAFFSQRKYRDKTGKLIDVESSATLIRYQDKKVICIVSRDVSDRIRAEIYQQTLYEIAKSISHTKSLTELARAIHQILGRLIDTRCFYLYIYNENDDSISITYWVNELPHATPLESNEVLVRQLIKEGRSILINANDPLHSDQFGHFNLRERQIQSWLGLPLKLENRTIGAVVIQSYENDHQFSRRELEMLELVSPQIALVIAHKKAEQELITTHQIYRAAIENAQGVPYKLSYSKNTYDILGEGVKELIGLEANEITFDRLRGLKQQIIIPDPRYADNPLEYGRAFRRGEIDKYRTDFLILTSNGERKWISDCAVPIRDDASGKVIGSLGILQDITERKRTEEALKASEERYRHVVEDQTELICRHRPDGTITFVNEACCRFFNIKREEIIGKILQLPVPEQDQKVIMVQQSLLSVNNPVISYEHQVYGPNGKIYWFHRIDRALFDDQGTLQEYQTVARDITKRKQAEEELEKYRLLLEDLVIARTKALRLTNQALLKELAERKRTESALELSKRRFELLYEENPSMYFTIDLKGKILSVNKFGAEQLGYSVAELLGKPVSIVIYKEDQKIVRQQLRNIKADATAILSWQFRKIRKDRTIIWVKESVRLIKNDEGKSMVLIVCEDITDRIKTQNERELLMKQLAEREKLATLGQWSAVLTHEINNPLDIILTKVDALKDDFHHLPEVLTYAEKIKAQVIRIHDLAKDILSYARPQLPEFSSVDVNKILIQSIEVLRGYHRDEIKITTKLKSNLPAVAADAVGLGIVFKNIILNAIQSIPKEGTVLISTHLKNGMLRISVRDNGIGIEKKQLKTIFDPFYTSKPPSKGTGLGLAISLEIVKKHQGHIKVKSQLGTGTTFHVYLPTYNMTGSNRKG